MYVAGYPGTGRKTAVKNFVEAQAKVQPVPLTGVMSKFCQPVRAKSNSVARWKRERIQRRHEKFH